MFWVRGGGQDNTAALGLPGAVRSAVETETDKSSGEGKMALALRSFSLHRCVENLGGRCVGDHRGGQRGVGLVVTV